MVLLNVRKVSQTTAPFLLWRLVTAGTEPWLTPNNSPIKSVVPALSGKVILKMGIFPRIPAPEFETFAMHRHPWQGTHNDMAQYKTKAGGEKLDTPVARPQETKVEDFPHGAR